ncbi:MAG: DUF6125 family protein [Desulfatiglans sp.]|jgi:hypothetical protein|nr:DUF6125 family protein [Thermodesulfobacteriota bacterium]MEE4351735.1 DUF6125 family protein [Desulfatiglans sp.]
MGTLDTGMIDKLERDRMRELLDVYGKLTLTIDGLWIQAVEKKYGTDVCVKMYTEVMVDFGKIQARRMAKFLGIPLGNATIQDMVTVHTTGPWGRVGASEYIQISDKELELRFINCHPQTSRKARGQAIFPCKEMEKAELAALFGTLNSKARIECVFSPPDNRPAEVNEDVSCAWKVIVDN